MSPVLSVRAVHQSGMHFVVDTGRHTVDLDYPLRPGPTAGPTPLEMVLASLAVCAGSTVALVLTRMNQPCTGLRVEAKGERREEHPTVMTAIELEFVVCGTGLDQSAVLQAVKTAEDRLCPVWAMLKPGTPVTTSVTLVDG